MVQKITKTKGADKCKEILKSIKNATQINDKMTPELNKKRCLKTYPPKQKNASKVIPKSLPKNEWIWGVGALLVALTAFGRQKWAHSAPKVLPTIKKMANHDTKELVDCEKEFQKSSFFGA